jgi:ABC-type multidrug transport system fused ATPase/permease subunit
MRKNRWLFSALYRVLAPHAGLLAGVVITSLLMILGEGVGIGVVFVSLGQMSGRITQWLPSAAAAQQGLSALPLKSQVLIVSLILISVTAARSACAFFSQYWSYCVRIRVEEFLRSEVFRQLHDVQLVFVERQKQGSWLPLLSQSNFQTGQLIFGIAQAMGSAVVILFYVLFLLYLNGPVTFLVALMLAVPIVVMRFFLANRIRKASLDTLALTKQLYAVAQEHISGLKTIQIFQRQAWSLRRFREYLQARTRANAHEQALFSINRPLFEFLSMTAVAGVLIVSAYLRQGLVSDWQGQILLFLVVALRLMGPVSDISQLQAQLAQNAPAFQSIMEFLNPADKPFLKNGTIAFAGLEKEIRLDHVSFRYPGEKEFVLWDLSLSIPKGRFTAVVGASGAGKTTLVNLLTRMYDCTDGAILVDGKPLQDLELGSWHSKVAVVNQDAFLFHMTALENLRFAKPDATEAEIEDAARRAQAHELLTTLPEGYRTNLLDRGLRLSGGQQQRIALARALLMDAEVLILDEATSELDSQTENAIQQALENNSRGQAVLAIAHRLSTIFIADCIYVMESGRVVEFGRHDDLMAKRGAYWRLVEAQSMQLKK